MLWRGCSLLPISERSLEENEDGQCHTGSDEKRLRCLPYPGICCGGLLERIEQRLLVRRGRGSAPLPFRHRERVNADQGGKLDLREVEPLPSGGDG